MRARFRRLPFAARLAVLAGLLAVGLLAAGYAYLAIQTAGAPPEAKLTDEPVHRASKGGVNGLWHVRADPKRDFLGYRAREILGVLPAPNDAVGRTAAVAGNLTISDDAIVAGTVTADMTLLQSDQDARDGAMRHTGLQTDSYPTATFRLTRPVDVGSPSIGRTFSISAVGNLNLHGVTSPIAIPLSARWNGDSFQVAGGVTFSRKKFNLEIDQQLGLRIDDNVRLEIQLAFLRGRGPAEPGAAAAAPDRPDRPPRAHPTEPIARDTDSILVSAQSPNGTGASLYQASLDGRAPRLVVARLHRMASNDYDPDVAPDGRSFVYSHETFYLNADGGQPPALYVRSLQGGPPTRIATHTTTADQPSFSPDGRSIAFGAMNGNEPGHAIMIVDAHGGRARLLSGGSGVINSNPAWSPDGHRIAFSSFKAPGNDDLFVIGADGAGLRRLTAGPAYDLTPDWSPDGKTIVFARDGDIWLTNAAGGHLRQLTSGSERDSSPAWSPDGIRIMFVRGDTARGNSLTSATRVIVMNADGRRMRRLQWKSTRESLLSPAWLSGRG